MTRVGLFLSVKPTFGGMFQYASSMLDALASLVPAGDLVVAYCDERWEKVLSQYPCKAVPLILPRSGLALSDLFVGFRFGGAVARVLSSILNPLARQLDGLQCDYWVFTAQESLGYQIKTAAIVSIHDVMHRHEPEFPEVSRWGRTGLRDHRIRNLVTNACAVLTDSQLGKRHLVEAYEIDASKIHPLPYVPPSYIFNEIERADLGQYYKLPPKFIFYPAQFWRHKNHIRLIRAVMIARSRGIDVRLVCSGAFKYEYETARKLVDKEALGDIVSFIGYVPESDMAGIYRRARALVMPTHFGPTNIPPLEAFACGCPVAVSNIYAMPEQLGDAAIYFDPTSSEEIADAISILWEDDALCRELGERGLKRSAEWRQENFASRLAAILDHVACG